jgi:hypothetical protein
MVEYETLGLVLGVVGVVSFQIKMVNDRLKEEIHKANTIHKELCDKITKHLNKCKCGDCC